MKINSNQLEKLGEFLQFHALLSVEELEITNELASSDFAFAPQLEAAESIHFHIHVHNTRDLPAEELAALGGEVVNRAEGYVKYTFPNGINLIFSHIPVAQRERTVHGSDQPYLDHIGIDIRSEEKSAYLAFQQIPLISATNDYLFTRQGDGKGAVKCCHMQVKEKYWVYPNPDMNYEFAFGNLVICQEGDFGVDLRPANPFNKIEDTSACCGSTTAEPAKTAIFIQN